MLADPCGAHLVCPYPVSEGSLARVHASWSISSDVSSCGYVIWAPDYSPASWLLQGSGATSKYTESNLFGWNAASSATSPNNDPSSGSTYGSATGFTSGVPMTTSSTLIDPAGTLNNESMVQDVRVCSACIRMVPTGLMQNMCGEVCYLDGLTIETLIGSTPTAGGATNPASVDRLFNYASSAHRMGGQPIETRYRPGKDSSTFRPTLDGPVHAGNGASVVPSYASESAETQQPTFFGIAWRGLDTTVGHPLVVDVIKNVEFRISPIAGMARSPPQQVSAKPLMPKALQVLDKSAPSWQVAHAQALAPTLAQIALGGLPEATESLVSTGAGFLAGMFKDHAMTALGAL